MTVRVGVNGFGRIGRNFLRAARAQGADLQVVAVNDLTDAATNAHLLRYDTTHGRFDGEVRAEGDDIVVAGERIRVLAERDPKALAWQDLGVEVVVESTGRFTSRSAASVHVEGGAQRVVISAPSRDAETT
jgi:glyceraldehyde 3-phosphate dehydrogenase